MHIRRITCQPPCAPERFAQEATQHALDRAAHTLAQIERDLDREILARGFHRRAVVRAEAERLLREAWERPQLHGEVALPALHREAGPWASCATRMAQGPGVSELDGLTLPWLLAAADVVGFVATILGSGDAVEISDEVPHG